MSATAIHPNSREAFVATATEREIYEARIMDLMADGLPRTDREIAKALDIESTQYRARIYYLVEASKLHEVGSKKCQWTRVKVRMTRRFL